MTGLPPPGTATEMYLAAVLDELRAIRDRLDPPASAEVPGRVELTEPAPPAPARPAAPARKTRAGGRRKE